MNEKFKVPFWIIIGIIAFLILLNLLGNGDESSQSDQTNSYLYPNYLNDSSSSSLPNENSGQIEDQFSKSSEMHWSHMPLTYKINEDSCGVSQPQKITGKTETQRMEWAFLVIQNETNYTITFEKTEGDPDIFVNCTSDYKHESYGGTIAEVTPYIWVGTNLYSYAEIQFYMVNPNAFTYGECTNYPTTEIHEVLHLLGVEHSISEGLMYEVSGWCPSTKETYIDKIVIDYLQKVYYKD